MGRRALRKLDPGIDLSGFCLEWQDLPQPFSAGQLFGREAPLEVEVGSGKGLFLAQASAANPDRDYLGVEMSGRYARFAAARLARQGQRNAKILHADAARLFAELLPATAAVAVHIYFPDPWWKKRHQKRRIISERFVRDVERVLEPAGKLHFWTDVEAYYRSTLELIASHTSLLGPLPVPEQPAAHDLDYRTHFERRMRLHGLPVFRAEFRKGSAPAPDP